jgi:hypothetical protein
LIICEASAKTLSLRDAVAPKTEFAIALLVEQPASGCEGERIPDHHGLLRRPPDRDPRPRCWHNAEAPLDRLPDWDWSDICAHLKCTKCGSVGWVDPRPNWGEVINFNKGVCRADR